MAAKPITVAKTQLVKEIKKQIANIGGGKKKFADPKVEGRVAGLREALAIVDSAQAA